MNFNISVIGAGSWGSALAIAFSHISLVKLWVRDYSQKISLQQTRSNPKYLPEAITFPLNIEFISALDELKNSDLLVIATPVNALRDVLLQVRETFSAEELPSIIWASKGFELVSGMLPHQIISEILGDVSDNIGALLGPSFANEVARGLPTAVTLASKNLSFALALAARLCKIPNFRVYAHDDLIGSEVGAGVKNIIAIGVGIADGLNLGANSRAALITRGLHELSKLVLVLGGQMQTIYGLSGVGDLILTCTGDLSRNRNVGLALAQGGTIDEVLIKLGHVAEGVYAAQVVYNIAQRFALDMPIVTAVYNIIYNKHDIKQTVLHLLGREFKREF